jgi:hypothetical protein
MSLYNSQQQKKVNKKNCQTLIFGLAVDCVSPYWKSHSSALLLYRIFDFAPISFEQVDRGFRALLVLFLRILELCFVEFLKMGYGQNNVFSLTQCPFFTFLFLMAILFR